MTTKTTPSNSELFNKYLDSCKGEVKSRSTEGYYHVDVVADAYNQGFSDGKKSGKKEFIDLIISNEVEKFTQKANQIYILSKNVISTIIQKRYAAAGLYINLTPERPSVIISIPNEFLNNDDFVKVGYSKIHENKKIYAKLFDEMLDIGFVSSDNLEEDLLKEDGFGYIEKY